MRYLSTVTLAGKRDSRCLVRVLTRIIVVVEPSYQMNMLFRDFIILRLGEGSTSLKIIVPTFLVKKKRTMELSGMSIFL